MCHNDFNNFISIDFIQELFNQKIKKSNSRGIDFLTPLKFEKLYPTYAQKIHSDIINNCYQFSPYREKLISKGRNKYPRIISIPCIKDKILLTCLNEYLKINFDIKMNMANSIIHDINETLKKCNNEYSFIRTDFSSFFSSINHDILLKKIKMLDARAILLIERAIKNCTVTTSGMKLENNEGVPQGIPISNLLAEIYVMELDHEINETVFFYKRYVDDTIIITNHKYLDLQKLKHKCNELKIKLNNEKTKMVNIQNTISFLGYSLSKNKISVSKKSCENHFKRISSIFKRYSINVKNQNDNEKTIIEELTMLLAGAFSELKRYGWLPYYSMMTDIKILYRFDAFVIKKLKKYNYIHLEQNIPKMVRAYFALRDGTWNKYAFSFDNKTIKEKIEILQRRGLYPSDGRNLSEYEIDIMYKRFIKSKTQMLDFDLGRRY